MNPLVTNLWLIPALPLLAAGLTAVAKQRQRGFAASLAIGAMFLALILSCAAFVQALQASGSGETVRQIFNFTWFHFGDAQLEAGNVRLGWVLDPLTAVMLVMVTFVGLLIFIYTLGYMAHDENFTRFYCFLSLFAAAMLGLIIANNLLLLFICWELVGLTSYLLIGFWYHKPSAAAAAKKAFITTRIGDVAFLLGMVWLYSQTGTLLFYDHGQGCLEPNALAGLTMPAAGTGVVAATGIALLIFCGAIGKSGQLPLHVWLPDAMEGPTPVSALIHAATMVAAGVFLVARVYPLMKVAPGALETITWVGAITAVFAASIAVAQTDMKRILAYSTVSQLGFMMLGLGAGGVAVGMFHLITHAFFKALLFLGAGSVIHGCHEEQDVRCMGGLRKYMPVTFATYAVGMMALSGVPILFSGFWSKDEILHAAHDWPVSRWPFYLGVAGAFLTAFYMTRQICHVFFGTCRLELGRATASEQRTVDHAGAPVHAHPHHELPQTPHESPAVMTWPLIILAGFSTLPLGLLGTPAWPWFQNFITGEQEKGGLGRLFESEVLGLMLLSAMIVALGIGLGWWLYGRRTLASADETDVLERRWPDIFVLLKRKYFVDEMYEGSVIWLNAWFARACDWLDEWIWGGLVQLVSYVFLGLSWLNRVIDEQLVNRGFDGGCLGASEGGRLMSRLQDGRVQHYLRIIGIGLVVLVLLSIWGCSAQ
jgi:NADH-quinone oxidoreductase subunit L